MEAGESGHLIYDGVNERSKEFLCKCIDAMDLSKDDIRLIFYADRKKGKQCHY